MHELLSFPAPPLALTKAQTAKQLSICLRTLDNLIAAKQITVRRVGRRVIIPITSINAFLLKDHNTQKAA